jgi:hypothetical protein
MTDSPLLSPDEEALLKKVSRSQLWRLIMDALVAQREALFSGHSTLPGLSGQPATNESLWRSQGAILLIQYLLQNGPAFVVYYQRHRDEQEAERQAKKVKATNAEREFNPASPMNERPEFDI